MSQYFPEPQERFKENLKVEFDLSNYKTKKDLDSLKAQVYKLDVEKFKTVRVELNRLSKVLNNDVITKSDAELVTKVNAIDIKAPSTKGLV